MRYCGRIGLTATPPKSGILLVPLPLGGSAVGQQNSCYKIRLHHEHGLFIPCPSSIPAVTCMRMALLSILLQGVAVYGASWLLWSILRRLFTRHPLDNIPGPPAGSFFAGNWGSKSHRSLRISFNFLQETSRNFLCVQAGRRMTSLLVMDPSQSSMVLWVLVFFSYVYEVQLTREQHSKGCFSSTTRRHFTIWSSRNNTHTRRLPSFSSKPEIS